ncbi:MAG: hypothetical protein Q4P29_05575 [Tissierellia bacterium]|nr:hypothetical protein [Tissierellia bacterium]
MDVKLSKEKVGIAAIAGHVGCGHCHSLNNQVQDDSCGLSVVLTLFKKATGLSLKIEKFEYDGNKVTAVLESGGKGEGVARRGITPQEKRLAEHMVGKEVINTHTLVLDAFGRIYGQGVLETPVAYQAAIANAALNTFVKNYPDNFVTITEGGKTNSGVMAGTVLDIDGVPISVLGTVNTTTGGLGPMEDMEGNSMEFNKGEIIKALGMDKLPTIIVEAMIFSTFSEGLEENTYFVRADEVDDNIVVANCLVEAGKKMGVPIKYHPGGGMKRTKDALRKNSHMVADKIIELGKKLRECETSEDKVLTIADLAIAVSQDCGGISFMSNEVHERLGGAGILQRTSCVINLVSCPEYFKDNPIPWLSDEEAEIYTELVAKGILEVVENIEEAQKIVDSLN